MDKPRWTWSAVLMLLPGVGLVLLYNASAFVMTIAGSFNLWSDRTDTGFTLEGWRYLQQAPFLDSVKFTVTFSLAAPIISVAAAYLVAILTRRFFPGKSVFNTLVKIPYYAPGLAMLFLFVNVLSYGGIVNSLLMQMRLIQEPLNLIPDQRGISMIALLVIFQFPFNLILIGAAMEGINQHLIDAARDLGARKWQVYRHVLFPLTLGNGLLAVILGIIDTFGSYQTPRLIGPTYPRALAHLFWQTLYDLFDLPRAYAIATFQMVAALAMVGLYVWLARRVNGGAKA